MGPLAPEIWIQELRRVHLACVTGPDVVFSNSKMKTPGWQSRFPVKSKFACTASSSRCSLVLMLKFKAEMISRLERHN